MSTSLLALSFALPFLALAQDASSTLPPAGYNGGADTPQDPSDAGAAGAAKGAFTLSSGALAAIIVVAVVVVVGGIASASLWWLAKKRQWDVRQSLRRASRRITGRAPADSANAGRKPHARQTRENRRASIRLASPSALKRERDVEKGNGKPTRGGVTTTVSSVGA